MQAGVLATEIHARYVARCTILFWHIILVSVDLQCFAWQEAVLIKNNLLIVNFKYTEIENTVILQKLSY